MLRSTLAAFLLTCSFTVATAQNTTPVVSHQWKQVAGLPPGTPLLLRLNESHITFPCSLVWIDLNALACESLDRNGSAHRVVYPASTIASIKPEPTEDDIETTHHNHVLLIGAATGALVGGLAFSKSGPGQGFAGGGIGALFGIGITAGPGLMAPPRPYGYRAFPLHRFRVPRP